MVRKIVRYIFTYLGAVFLMSYIISNNVGAVSPVIDLNNYDVVNFYPYFNINCQFTNENDVQLSFPQNVSVCQSPTSSTGVVKLRRLYSYNTYTVQKDDILEFYVLAFSPVTLSSLQAFTPGVISTGSNLYFLMDMQQVANNVYGSTSFSILNGTGDSFNTRSYYSVFKYTFKVLSGGNWNIGFILPDNYFVFSSGTMNFALYNLTIYRKGTEDPANAEQEQKTQEAADASADAGDDSTSDAEAGTASLISAIGSAVTAISSASPTNCKINGNMGNLNMGQIDLCANPVPTFISVIGSLILILITVPLCITLFNRFIALFRSFQS